MSFLFHLRSVLHQGARRQKARRVPPCRPTLEALETRAVPSVSYTFHTIDDPNAGTTGSPLEVQGTFSVGINDRGEISGNYGDANYLTHGFLLSHGHYSSFDDPNAGTTANPSTDFFPGTDAFGLNNRGQIVGAYIDANNVEHSFLLNHGNYTTIDPPGAAELPGPFTYLDQAATINDRGQIVGGYTDANGVTHGYLLSHGKYTVLDDPNAVFTYAAGINDRGQIAGQYIDSNGVWHGFLLSHGQYTTLDDPNAGTAAGQGTLGYGINNLGQIVGWYFDAEGAIHGFVLSGGQYTTLDEPNGVGATFSEGINDYGQIVGFYADSNELIHGFIATPTYGHGYDNAIGAFNVFVGGGAHANATSPGTQTVNAASIFRDNPGDSLRGTSAGQTLAIVMDTNSLMSTEYAGAIVDALFGRIDELFQSIRGI